MSPGWMHYNYRMPAVPARLVRTKIIPPPRSARTLSRPRVNALLRQALEYRLELRRSHLRALRLGG